MRARLVGMLLLGLGVLFAVPERAAAVCTADPLAADVHAARAAIAGRCDCAGATSRRHFVRCAVGVARTISSTSYGATRSFRKRLTVCPETRD
jgi:hypothetical protein